MTRTRLVMAGTAVAIALAAGSPLPVAAAPADPAAAALSLSGDLSLISTSSAGVKQNLTAEFSHLSASAELAAFASTASNLDPADTDTVEDVYVKDTSSGLLALVSTSDTGVKGNRTSRVNAISADGGTVAFESQATNLDPGDLDTTGDVFVKDLATGDITLASTTGAGTKGNDESGFQLGLNRQGTRVVFQSTATNLDPLDADTGFDVYLKRLGSGSLTLISTSTAGVKGNGASASAAISSAGGSVAFESRATNLDPADSDTAFDIYVKDVSSGTLELASTSAAGVKGNDQSSDPSIAKAGAKVAFASTATNLDPADTDADSDIYMKNLNTGALTLVSAADDGTKADGESFSARISGNGRFVAFSSNADNLDPDDTNGHFDVYIKDLATGDVALVSATPAGVDADSDSFAGAISGAGKRVSFQSFATNLDPQDTDPQIDLYLKQPVLCGILGGSGADTLNGTPGDDVICGRGGNDTIDGEGGDDIVFGERGRDTLVGGSGSDVLVGGAGGDTADYADSPDSVFVDLTADTASGGDATGDALDTIENLTGGRFVDSLTGDARDNTLDGRGSEDTLAGGGGADVLTGGDGVDLVDYRTSPAAVTVDLPAGTVGGGDADGDTIDSIEGAIGSSRDDTLTGDGGDNVFIGMAGGDSIDGGGGVDLANYVFSPASVNVNLFNATAKGGDAAGDVLTGIENLGGTALDDTLKGDDGPNALFGSDGADTLVGKDGDDQLFGQGGIDTFDGSGGTDTCDNVAGESATDCEP